MYKNILVPVDLNKPKMAESLCEAANRLASLDGAKVRLMTVLPGYSMPMVASYFPEGAQKELKKSSQAALEDLAKSHFSGEVKISIRSGKRASEILSIIHGGSTDLVVLGARRKQSRGGERLLGSCSSSVSDRAACSVLVVR